MTLMKFLDPSERDIVLGPLYATEAKTDIPIFGPEKFTSRNIKQLLNSTVKQALQSETNPVVNLLATTKSKMSQVAGKTSQPDSSLSGDLERLQLEAQERDEKVKSRTSRKISSSRELHDEAHYTRRSISTSAESKKELLDHVMLQRAIDGYLFNCNLNNAIVNDDVWLQEVWEWIEGKQIVLYVGLTANENFRR
jgi:hypothetical protein